jgi:hypothetical protein
MFPITHHFFLQRHINFIFGQQNKKLITQQTTRNDKAIILLGLFYPVDFSSYGPGKHQLRRKPAQWQGYA